MLGVKWAGTVGLVTRSVTATLGSSLLLLRALDLRHHFLHAGLQLIDRRHQETPQATRRAELDMELGVAVVFPDELQRVERRSQRVAAERMLGLAGIPAQGEVSIDRPSGHRHGQERK